MTKSIFLTLVLLAPAAALAGPTLPPPSATTSPADTPLTPQAKRDFSTADATLQTFAAAIKLCDADALVACFSPIDDSDKLTPVFMDLICNSLRLKRAAGNAFGESSIDQFQFTGIDTALETGRQAASAGHAKVEGVFASLHVNRDVTLQLHLDKDTWTILPYTFISINGEQRAAAEAAVPILRATSAALVETRKEIEAGKYKKPTEAASRARTRLLEAARAAARAQTQPATKP